ncbi:SPOR domain-containing protein [uncultured Muribaculum sp.]|uniref:SPOR domain-containing protein n=1 Tax=uncultured Muribaculum sp. TaxID=1918613 RepID=UPI0025F10C41|nr:SPOR domain-containing protein [uncultured Muribaculum sp.]
MTAVLAIAATFSATYAQTTDDTTALCRPSIEEHIAADSIIIIRMPDALRERLRATEANEQEQARTVAHGRTGGYRIQIFADNNPRTAKNEARTRARNVVSRFADYPSYVEYKAPYWRTRIGNFRTHDEADKAAAEIKEAFPGYSREIRVVRDRIIVGE